MEARRAALQHEVELLRAMVHCNAVNRWRCVQPALPNDHRVTPAIVPLWDVTIDDDVIAVAMSRRDLVCRSTALHKTTRLFMPGGPTALWLGH